MMEVKITQIGDLEALSSKIQEYSSSTTEALNGAEIQVNNKLEGTKADVATEYLNVISELKASAFSSLPEASNELAKALQTYHGSLTGANFVNKIKSVSEVVDDYCNTKVSTAYEKIDEEGTDIETAINEAAAVLPTISESKIGDNSQTLETNVKGKTKEVTSTKETVESAKTAFISQMESAASQLAECLSSIENAMQFTHSKNGLSAKALVGMFSSGLLGRGTIQEMMNSSEDKDQKALQYKALTYLMEGKEDKLFEMDPESLSNDTYALIMLYLDYLVEHENMAKIESFANGLLGQVGESASTRIESYLTRFSAETAIQFQQVTDLMLLSNGHFSQEDYDKLLAKCDRLDIMGSLMEALNYARNNSVTKSQVDGFSQSDIFNYASISGLTIDSATGSITFTATKHQTASLDKDFSYTPYKNDKSIGLRDHSTKIDWDQEKNRKEVKEYRKKVNNVAQDLILTMGLIGVGLWNPAASTALGMLLSLSSGEATIKNIRNTIKSTKPIESSIAGSAKAEYQASLKELVGRKVAQGSAESYKLWNSSVPKSLKALDLSLEFFEKYQGNLKKLNAAEKNVLYDILGIGGTSVTVGSGKDEKVDMSLKPLEQCDYFERLRINELMSNGYNSYFDSLPQDKGKALKDYLEGIKENDREMAGFTNEKHRDATIDFILNGGNPVGGNVQIEMVDRLLRESIENTVDFSDESYKEWFTNKNNHRFGPVIIDEVTP